MFKEPTYTNRRIALKESFKTGLILLLGNDESPMNYKENIYPFRQDASFLYYFGLDMPGLAAIIDVDENMEIVFGNDLTTDEIVWMGDRPSLKELSAEVGIGNTMPTDALGPYLQKAKATGRQIHFLPQYRAENKIKLFNFLKISPGLVNAQASETLIKAVVKAREIKSNEEIADLHEAANITADMHMKAMEMARPGMTEAEIAAEIERVAMARGKGISFPVILTINGQTLHNHYHGNILREGRLVLNDSGAQTINGYTGDMSRTFPVSPKFTDRQKEIYSVSLKAHEAAIAGLEPGVAFRDIHRTACLTITEGLRGLGLMKGDPEAAYEAGAHTLFFPCGTGHMIGLDVHDMEGLGEDYVGYGDGYTRNPEFGFKSLRLAKPLKPGFAVTIEPGIYFIPKLIDAWRETRKCEDFINYDRIETYKDFGGLRCEEAFIITDTGAELLGKPAPKTIEDIEATRG